MKNRLVTGLAIAAIASTAFVGVASAQYIDTAAGGNGGVSTADSSGGSVSVGSTNTRWRQRQYVRYPRCDDLGR